jgi:hypothetical protein
MLLGFRGAALAFAMTAVVSGTTAARAGDDGQAPLWVGIGSIFSGIPGIGWGKEEKPPIDYHEHGKIVVPPKLDLPPPGEAVNGDSGGDWPVNQEGVRKKAQKDAAKQVIAGQGDARLRYTHPFPSNEPVTVRASDQVDPTVSCPHGKCDDSSQGSVLGSLNPLGWVGLGKKTPLGPEPDREWLTDPPKGYRAPVAAGQAAN